MLTLPHFPWFLHLNTNLYCKCSGSSRCNSVLLSATASRIRISSLSDTLFSATVDVLFRDTEISKTLPISVVFSECDEVSWQYETTNEVFGIRFQTLCLVWLVNVVMEQRNSVQFMRCGWPWWIAISDRQSTSPSPFSSRTVCCTTLHACSRGVTVVSIYCLAPLLTSYLWPD